MINLNLLMQHVNKFGRLFTELVFVKVFLLDYFGIEYILNINWASSVGAIIGYLLIVGIRYIFTKRTI